MADVDANTQFGGFLTQMGINRRNNAVAQNSTWRITHMLLGDGGGELPTPDSHATGLVNEVYRAPINHLYQDPDNPGMLIVEMIIPPEIGGWWIRELGAEDEDGHFVAVANCPPSYKPQLPQGSTRDQTVRMRLITSHIDHIELKIDPSIVTASRSWVEVLVKKLDTAITAVVQAQTKHRSSDDHDERYARRGQNLSDLTNSSTARSNLGLGTMATRATGTSGNSFRTNTQNDDRFVQQSRQINTGAGLSGGGNLSANRTLSLDNATITSLSRADSAVQPARTITTGDGLSGGGNLSANRTLSVDSSVVRTSRAINTGTGLSGGGNLSANRTLSLDKATITSLSRADSAVQPARTITAGDGLSGGGNLSANRTLSLDKATITSLSRADSAVQPARTITAGDGLSGGGSLSANRTLSVDSSVVRTSRAINTGTGLSGGGNLSANRTLSLDNATIASLSRADSAVQPARTITTGDGLSGGGNLSANRTLSVDSSVVRTSRVINTGTGLSGGGNLSANRTLSLDKATITSLSRANSAVQPDRTITAGDGLSGGGNLSSNRTLSVDSSVARSNQFNRSGGSQGGQDILGQNRFQWGFASITASGKAQRVNFPMSFNSTCACVTANHIGTGPVVVIVGDRDASGFDCRVTRLDGITSGELSINYIAVGY
ncbi:MULTISPECIES: phage tail-collar fiber domain-containing protein [unclassified Halomonas]|uniref:phage tail-collar fiber domain-containing protein n=3 Tax=Halomonas TaxID=2745 RepID=UPI000686F349|nr:MULTISPECIES: phage tail protein [unclassified Halomonas]